MDPNENLNARFSIVRALQGYTVIGVLCIQTIPVLFSFSFFLSFFLSFPFSFSSFLEPRVKTRLLTFRKYASFTIEKTERGEIIWWEHDRRNFVRRLF